MKKTKLAPCPIPRCASESQGRKRPLVPIGDECEACKDYFDGFE